MNTYVYLFAAVLASSVGLVVVTAIAYSAGKKRGVAIGWCCCEYHFGRMQKRHQLTHDTEGLFISPRLERRVNGEGRL